MGNIISGTQAISYNPDGTIASGATGYDVTISKNLYVGGTSSFTGVGTFNKGITLGGPLTTIGSQTIDGVNISSLNRTLNTLTSGSGPGNFGTGNFSGLLSASGGFTGTSGTFTNSLNVGSISSTGAITSNGVINANGGITTNTLTSSGAVSGLSGNFRGTLSSNGLLTANAGITTNALTSSGVGNFSGLLTASGGFTGTSGTFANSLNVGSISSTGAITSNGIINANAGITTNGLTSSGAGNFSGLLTASGGFTGTSGTFTDVVNSKNINVNNNLNIG